MEPIQNQSYQDSTHPYGSKPYPPPDRKDGMSTREPMQMLAETLKVNLAPHRAKYLALGLALVAVGILAMSASVMTTVLSVVLFGWLLTFGGIFQIAHSFVTPRWSGFFLNLIVGVLGVITGMMLISNPGEAAVTLTLLMAVYFLIAGVSRIAFAIGFRQPQWGWACLSGAMSIVLSTLLFSSWPVVSYWFIGFCVGLDLITSGVSYLAFASWLKNPHGHDRIVTTAVA